jgi:DNA-directed RNA polymerase subunit E'/Rpb7
MSEQITNSPFATSMLTMKVYLSMIEIGNNIKENMKKKIAHQVEGKCIKEGYIMKNSVEVVTYTAGKINMENVVFDVIYKCDICLPVKDMVIECLTKTITKAGIKAEYIVDNEPVMTVFISRDDNYDNEDFLKIKGSNVSIFAKVIGVSYELNEPTITVMADLVV